jgi:DNA polymerase phi
LQLYDEDSDAPAILQDLNTYQHSYRRNSPKNNDAGQPESIIEIILSFLFKPSRFFHQSGLLAFRAFTSQVSRSGLQSLARVGDVSPAIHNYADIWQVLGAKEGPTRTQDIFDVEDRDGHQQDGHSSSLDASDSEIRDSDVEQLSEKSSLDEEPEDHSQEDQDELKSFDAKLAAALGTCRGQDDLDEEGVEGSDEDMYEEDLDGEGMEALDEKLAEVFRAMRPVANKKQERKDTKEAIINFKRRVLDLTDVYLKQEQLNPLALHLLLPLITTAKTTSIKQISGRAHEILQGFCSRCKGPNVPVIAESEINAGEALGYLKAVHEEAGLDNARAHTTACSRASILLVKVLVKAEVDVGKIVDVYAETRKKQLLNKNCKVPPAFFTEWSNWCTSARDQLAR